MYWGYGSMTAKAEWEPLKSVLMHRPGVEIEYAMLAPRPFLFERCFHTTAARTEHKDLQDTLSHNGVKVQVLKDGVVKHAKDSSEFRKALEEEVVRNLIFYGEIGDTEKAREEFKKNIETLDPENLFDFLTLEPSVDLKKTENVQYPTIYSNVPLANLYFMRDQQITATEGIVVGNMKSLQRRKETEITEFFLRRLSGNGTVKRIDSGFLEGGDYIPAGDFAIFGTGPRTDLQGVRSAVATGSVDFDEICVVENPVYDFMEGSKRDPMINMHVDTYFNIAGDGIAVGSRILLEKARGAVYALDGQKLERLRDTTLMKYIKEKGFNLLDLSIREQLSYSSNFLTLSDKKIVAVNSPLVLERLMKSGVFSQQLAGFIKSEQVNRGDEFPRGKRVAEFGIDVIEVELSELTGGYGGAHCMTASLQRG